MYSYVLLRTIIADYDSADDCCKLIKDKVTGRQQCQWLCPVPGCIACFCEKKYLKQHMMRSKKDIAHVSFNDYICQLCGFRCMSETSLLKHCKAKGKESC